MIGIFAAKRTAIGSFQGQFSQYSATDLGAHAIKAIAKSSTEIKIDEVLMGCVLQAGLGQAPARQASIKAGLSHLIPATTINKVCGSGMQSIIFACDSIRLGRISAAIAGGMESMTNAPYALEKSRSGYRFGHNIILDLMLHDGLEDSFAKLKDKNRCAMGHIADTTAAKYEITRDLQERFAKETYEKALNAQNSNAFEWEITPITHKDRNGEKILNIDEQITRVNPEKFSSLKPAFNQDGSITAATSSSIADGSAAIMLSSNYKEAPFKIAGYICHAQSAETFTEAPIQAIEKLCKQIDWNIKSVDAFEINEAFAIVPILAINNLGIPREKVNIFGGACAIGHPIGVSGARIVVTLLNIMQKYELKRGIAAVCIGGGEATAIAIER